MNLATIERRVYDRMGYHNDNPGTIIVRKIRGFINETYRELVGRKGFEQFRRQELDFFCTANDPIMVLPQAVNKVYSLFDTVNQNDLDLATMTAIRAEDPGKTRTGTPYAFAPYNQIGAAYRQPEGTGLWASSSSASDNSTKHIFVEGVTTSGTFRRESSALNGVTLVQVGTTTIWGTITRVYIQIPATQGLGAITTAVGNVVLYSDVAATIGLAAIPPGASTTRYPQVYLYPTPTALIVYTGDCEMRIQDLVEEGDEPLLPENYHWLLGSGAIIKEYASREKSNSIADEKKRYNDGLGELIMYANRLPSKSGGRQLASKRWSQLGALFPSGT